MDSGLFGALCVLLGTVTTHGLMIYNARLERESIERRHRREWAINAGIEQWKAANEVLMSKHKQGASVTLHPAETYILAMLTLIDELPDRKCTEAELMAAIDRMSAIGDAVTKKIGGQAG